MRVSVRLCAGRRDRRRVPPAAPRPLAPRAPASGRIVTATSKASVVIPARDEARRIAPIAFVGACDLLVVRMDESTRETWVDWGRSLISGSSASRRPLSASRR